MNSLERTIAFIKGSGFDRPPVHPIIMRFAAKYASVPYGRFCLDPQSKYSAAIKCADDFGLDWVTVMSDPYAEAFGLKVEYPHDSLPKGGDCILQSAGDFERLVCPKITEHTRLLAKIREVELYREALGDSRFIVGWVEGPLAEYADLRGLGDAMLDL